MKGLALRLCRGGGNNHPQTLHIACDADGQDTVVSVALGSPGSGEEWRARGSHDNIRTPELTAKAREGML